MIYIIGIIITSFLAFILVTKKSKSTADRLLFGWLCVILIHLTLFSVISSGKYSFAPYLLGLEIPLPLIHGPMLFLYTISLTTGGLINRSNSFHFFPFVLGLVAVLPFLILTSDDKISVYQNGGEGYSTLKNLILIAIIFSGVIYCVLSLRVLFNYKRLLKDNYSHTEGINLQWLFKLIIGLFFIWLIVILADDQYIFSCVVLYVLFIGYYGIKQVGIFTNQTPAFVSPVLEKPELLQLSNFSSENPKYEKSLLSDSQLEFIHEELLLLIKKKELYLIPDLNLAMVAQELDVHPNSLSQVINRIEQKNFFDFINSFRVEKFRTRVAMRDSHRYTLLSLAYECGFNSKTAFNRNFKNITGKSPSEYLREIKEIEKD